MKINPTAEGLALVLYTLQQSIKPELVSENAKYKISIIEVLLANVLSRQSPQGVGLLQTIIAGGRTLRQEMLDTISSADSKAERLTAPYVCSKPHLSLHIFDELAEQHHELTFHIYQLSKILARDYAAAPATPILLRRAAEWEISYPTKIKQVAVEPPKLVPLKDPPAPPLSLEFLSKYLIGRRNIANVSDLVQISGGNGKQTYSCVVHYNDGGSEHLIIRKDDEAPMVMRGPFQTKQESALVRSVSKTDLPVAEVYDFCPSIPGPDGVDGAFFIMERLPGRPPSNYFQKQIDTVPRDLLLQLATLLAEMHTTPLQTFSDYIDEHEDSSLYTKTTTEWYLREVAGWEAYYNTVEHLPSPYFPWFFDWLKRNVPQDTRTPVLVHGDFNVHNILAKDGKITGILDWECSNFGAPEQDLCYIHELVSRNMSWDDFIDHYRASGGPEIHPEYFGFCQAFGIFKATFACNRGTMNVQNGWSLDIRFHMMQLGYEASLVGMALSYTAEPGTTKLKSRSPGNG